ncbi:MAG: pitrilysin family protein [Planctomycetota bacterium]
MRTRLALAAGVCLVALAVQRVHANDEDLASLSIDVVKHELQNGMTVLMVERHDTPTVATYLQFNVGGVDDPKGQTGIAHLLEHMMFKGTETFGTSDYQAEKPLMAKLDQLWAELDAELASSHSPFHQTDAAKIASLRQQIEDVTAEQKRSIIKNELWQAYQRLGGRGLNASTGDDSTQYYVQLPKNQLAVWAYLESDRLANPVFREFYSERDVVHEERRMRTDTQPMARFSEAFQCLAYAAHPYRNPVVGWPSDIDATVRAEVLEYFKTYYAPNNCVAALVGDIDPAATIALMEGTFGKIPAKAPPRRNITEEPVQVGERRLTMRLDSAPMLRLAYPVPAAGHQDSYALTVAARVLSGTSGFGGGFGGWRGRRGGTSSGRLSKSLVVEKKIALNASANVSFGRYPGLFNFNATPAPETTLAGLEDALKGEIERLRNEPPTEEELARVRNAEDAAFVRRLRTNNGIAAAIVRAETLAGDWRHLLVERDKIKQVTAEDVARVVGQYLVSEHCTVGWLEGTESAFGGQEVQR